MTTNKHANILLNNISVTTGKHPNYEKKSIIFVYTSLFLNKAIMGFRAPRGSFRHGAVAATRQYLDYPICIYPTEDAPQLNITARLPCYGLAAAAELAEGAGKRSLASRASSIGKGASVAETTPFWCRRNATRAAVSCGGRVPGAMSGMARDIYPANWSIGVFAQRAVKYVLRSGTSCPPSRSAPWHMAQAPA